MFKLISWELKNCFKYLSFSLMVFILIYIVMCETLLLVFSVKTSLYQTYGTLSTSAEITISETKKIKNCEYYDNKDMIFQIENIFLTTVFEENEYPYFDFENFENVSARENAYGGTSFYYNSGFKKFAEKNFQIDNLQNNSIIICNTFAERFNINIGSIVKLYTFNGETDYIVAGMFPIDIYNYSFIVNVENCNIDLDENCYFNIIFNNFDLYEDVNDYCKNIYGINYKSNDAFEKTYQTILGFEWTLIALFIVLVLFNFKIIKEMMDYFVDKRKNYIFINEALGMSQNNLILIYSSIFSVFFIIPLLLGYLLSLLFFDSLSNKFFSIFGCKLLLRNAWLPPIMLSLILICTFLYVFYKVLKHSKKNIYSVLRKNI